jgi:hypothetical protein
MTKVLFAARQFVTYRPFSDEMVKQRSLTQGFPSSMESSMTTHELQGFSYQDRQGLLPVLTSAFTQCGGWVLERRTTSASSMEFRLEIQLQAIVELYSSLVESGVELTRGAHDTLTGLCTARHHIALSHPASQVVSILLELSFLEDVTLHSLLMTGGGLA